MFFICLDDPREPGAEEEEAHRHRQVHVRPPHVRLALRASGMYFKFFQNIILLFTLSTTIIKGFQLLLIS